LDKTFFFDVQIIDTGERKFIGAIVWLYDFQWSSWVRGIDGDEVLIEQWQKADVVISFNESARVMSLMRSEFGLEHDNYINLIDYCDDQLVDTADEIELEYPPELKSFDEVRAVELWNELIEEDPDAMDTLLYFRAWNTILIYNIFFKVSEGLTPLKIFVPWSIPEHKLAPKNPQNKTPEEMLLDTLQKTYDFSTPGATADT
jgi:hypothetical protein